jgi:hypothetical protein
MRGTVYPADGLKGQLLPWLSLPWVRAGRIRMWAAIREGALQTIDVGGSGLVVEARRA